MDVSLYIGGVGGGEGEGGGEGVIPFCIKLHFVFLMLQIVLQLLPCINKNI